MIRITGGLSFWVRSSKVELATFNRMAGFRLPPGPPGSKEDVVIEGFVKAWDAHKGMLRDKFAEKHPWNYKDVVLAVVEMFSASSEEYDRPDPERIHEINDGDYQGTLVFVIGAQGYQPSRYWYVKVGYGSCSGCDTLESIRSYSDGKPTEEQINDYLTLSLHIVQGLREMND
jgi:hypothetical protein